MRGGMLILACMWVCHVVWAGAVGDTFNGGAGEPLTTFSLPDTSTLLAHIEVPVPPGSWASHGYVSCVVMTPQGTLYVCDSYHGILYQYTNANAADPSLPVVYGDPVCITPSETTTEYQPGFPDEVTLNGEGLLAASAPYWDDVGAVFLFDVSGPVPVQVDTIMGTGNSHTGMQVCADGGTLAFDDFEGMYMYSIYDRTGDIDPALEGFYLPPDGYRHWPGDVQMTSTKIVLSGRMEGGVTCLDVLDRATGLYIDGARLCGDGEDRFADTYVVIEGEGEELLVVGSPWATVGGVSRAGTVDVFRWDEAALSYERVTAITSETPTDNEQFGLNVQYDIRASVLAVGQTVERDSGMSSGDVALFGCTIPDLLGGACAALGTIVPDQAMSSVQYGAVGGGQLGLGLVERDEAEGEYVTSVYVFEVEYDGLGPSPTPDPNVTPVTPEAPDTPTPTWLIGLGVVGVLILAGAVYWVWVSTLRHKHRYSTLTQAVPVDSPPITGP
ncbi:hypothetical protein KIPB_000846 [Kipferlia bialata]|uniref:Uncharacterized protein n=1 Tax=Kipferlia bialata TaxID=797122 RepID=A0A9K3GF08_9EUKA|nr:hypothetical protein KIPB_000846 [Kipferlia bialata]|eukprot:g846.t1